MTRKDLNRIAKRLEANKGAIFYDMDIAFSLTYLDRDDGSTHSVCIGTPEDMSQISLFELANYYEASKDKVELEDYLTSVKDKLRMYIRAREVCNGKDNNTV